MTTEQDLNKALADFLSVRAKYLYAWAGMDLCEIKDARDDLLAALHVLGVFTNGINDEVNAMVAKAEANLPMDQEAE